MYEYTILGNPEQNYFKIILRCKNTSSQIKGSSRSIDRNAMDQDVMPSRSRLETVVAEWEAAKSTCNSCDQDQWKPIDEHQKS